MPLRQWLKSPRHLLVVFLGVAGLSAGALVWLGWLLLKQDADLEAQRRQEPLEQAADQAVTTMQRAVANLKGIVSSPSADARLPADVTRISIDSRVLVVSAGAPLGGTPGSRESARASARNVRGRRTARTRQN